MCIHVTLFICECLSTSTDTSMSRRMSGIPPVADPAHGGRAGLGRQPSPQGCPGAAGQAVGAASVDAREVGEAGCHLPQSCGRRYRMSRTAPWWRAEASCSTAAWPDWRPEASPLHRGKAAVGVDFLVTLHYFKHDKPHWWAMAYGSMDIVIYCKTVCYRVFFILLVSRRGTDSGRKQGLSRSGLLVGKGENIR